MDARGAALRYIVVEAPMDCGVNLRVWSWKENQRPTPRIPTLGYYGCLGITHTTPVPQRYPQLDMEHRRFLRPRRFVGIPVDHITVKFWSSDKSQEPKSKRLGALGIVDHTVAPPAFLFERRIIVDNLLELTISPIGTRRSSRL